jgi:hypothetical protein
MEKNRNYRIYFINYKKRGDHVEYIIRLNCIEDNNLYAEFTERYSTLKDLHDAMKKEATKASNFPKFPPKKFFGNTDEIFLNQRQTELQKYFNQLFSSKELSNLPSLRQWILRVLEKFKVDIKPSNNQEVVIIDSDNDKLKVDQGSTIRRDDGVNRPKPSTNQPERVGKYIL